jgi:hydroxyethylthiazole kinase-like uncharacterized protein yjeF
MRRKARAEMPRPRVLTSGPLRAHPLPALDPGGSKEDRGRVLVVGGTRRTSGAVLLAALAALRAGAGKVQVATSRSAFALVAPQLPEGLLVDLPEDRDGVPNGRGLDVLHGLAERADALCIGPGLIERQAARRLIEGLERAAGRSIWVLDAAAIYALRGAPRLLERIGPRSILTPHAGEMAQLLDCRRETVEASAIRCARDFSRTHGCIVALKGAETVIAGPAGEVFLNRRGNAGLATAGSGDVLAGIVAACAARGASLLGATLHGVHTHALAGERLAQRIGAAGYLARELLDEVPAILFPTPARRRNRR